MPHSSPRHLATAIHQICRKCRMKLICAVEIICRFGLHERTSSRVFCSIRHATMWMQNGNLEPRLLAASMQPNNLFFVSEHWNYLKKKQENAQKAEIKYRSMTIDRSDKHDALDLNPLSHLVLLFFSSSSSNPLVYDLMIISFLRWAHVKGINNEGEARERERKTVKPSEIRTNGEELEEFFTMDWWWYSIRNSNKCSCGSIQGDERMLVQHNRHDRALERERWICMTRHIVIWCMPEWESFRCKSVLCAYHSPSSRHVRSINITVKQIEKGCIHQNQQRRELKLARSHLFGWLGGPCIIVIYIFFGKLAHSVWLCFGKSAEEP